MFFSVIIPTYNPRKYLNKLLTSIEKNDCKNEIEVIIADDLSTEDFADIITSHQRNLTINTCANLKHFGAPVGGRQNGAQIATGKWICFADQDDWFTDGAFDAVKKYIEENDVHNYLITNFYQQSLDSDEVTETIKAHNWTHGKFYESSFWQKFNIAYQNIHYCEDINLSVTVSCICAENNIEPTYFDYFTYVWSQHPDSLSNANQVSDYFFKSFPDYIKGTLGNYIERYKHCHRTVDVDNYYKLNIVSMFIYLYFYYQGIKWEPNECPKIPKKYYSLAYKYFKQFKKITRWNTKKFLSKINSDYIGEYRNVQSTTFNQIPYVESESFRTFIKLLPLRSII